LIAFKDGKLADSCIEQSRLSRLCQNWND